MGWGGRTQAPSGRRQELLDRASRASSPLQREDVVQLQMLDLPASLT